MFRLCRSNYSNTRRLLHNAGKAMEYEDAIRQLEQQGERILRMTRKLVEKRQLLLSKVQQGASASNTVNWFKDIKELEPLHDAWEGWMNTKKSLIEVLSLLNDSDPSMRTLAQEEYDSLRHVLSNYLSTVFPQLVLPPSTTAHLSAIVELRTGVGGTESSLFLADLLRMYRRLANSKTWKSDIISCNDNDAGGIKAAILEVQGPGSYDTMRLESGVHRVQRVPVTETSGRTHTSTVAVVVLPSQENTKPSQNSDDLNLDDVRVEVMRSRGAGGQHVNKTESAVRLTHLPTGITVSMQDERSQHQNKRRAFQILRARLLDLKLTKEMAEQRAIRNSLVKTADRNQKIRTYNFPQGRVTDHRIGLTLMNLTSVMEGNGLEDMHAALNQNERAAMTEEMTEGMA